MNQVWNVAVHESGHAIVAHSLNISVDQVSIVPSGNSLGYMQQCVGTSNAMKAMTIFAAGVAAEQLICGCAIPGGDRGDLVQAFALASGQAAKNGRRVEDILTMAMTLARARVTLLKPHVEKLAHDLMRRQTIPGTQIPGYLRHKKELSI